MLPRIAKGKSVGSYIVCRPCTRIQHLPVGWFCRHYLQCACLQAGGSAMNIIANTFEMQAVLQMWWLPQCSYCQSHAGKTYLEKPMMTQKERQTRGVDANWWSLQHLSLARSQVAPACIDTLCTFSHLAFHSVKMKMEQAGGAYRPNLALKTVSWRSWRTVQARTRLACTKLSQA